MVIFAKIVWFQLYIKSFTGFQFLLSKLTKNKIKCYNKVRVIFKSIISSQNYIKRAHAFSSRYGAKYIEGINHDDFEIYLPRVCGPM